LRWASRLSIRRAGPERSDEKNTSRGRSSVTYFLLDEAMVRVACCISRKHASQTRLRRVGDWYTIGLALGIGTAIGTLFAGMLSSTPLGRAAAVALGAAAGALAGVVIDDWAEVGAGAVGGLAGAAAGVVVVAGALRRGGTRTGLALLVAAAATGLAALAFVPGAGYLEAVALPVLAARLRRTQADRHAGLRSLARD
jgi:hypothetical protein